ncbi:MAG: UDP-N-acetylmuramoyl-tripeptide--D-alanyl-D-alanine ligase [Culturomica sp.]|jgi:UDP-N-acetylmuramoyl-tripeptide--D-alanyl-D-alanine ligase|nr:UDP-N-acetylmuramoyl-tripeptide--D-alanyl-D-alanine ligase [Culturomica sp.]
MDVIDLYERFVKGRRVTTDSRSVAPGDVFFALKGERFNGNCFAEQALKEGASCVVIDEAAYRTDSRMILVEDVLSCLQETAKLHRRRLGVPILGITGTNGKTTTKELCSAVLSRRFRTVATAGNYNNHIGVPLTLLGMDEKTEFGIVEMGANHPEEIRFLCRIADPDYGLITNIGRAHLEGFGSYEQIVRTKKELYDHIAAGKGRLFVSADDPLLMELSEGTERILYGQKEGIAKGEIKQSVPYLVLSLKTGKGDLYIKTKLTGGYNLSNVLAAVAAGLFFGMDPTEIRDAIEAYRPSNMRSQLVRTERNTVILDAYNANPGSMRAALESFAEVKAPHKMVILGEMKELGAESETAHSEIVALLTEKKFDEALLVGNHFEHCCNSCTFIRYFEHTEALADYLGAHRPENSFILVKGSRGNRLEQMMDYL